LTGRKYELRWVAERGGEERFGVIKLVCGGFMNAQIERVGREVDQKRNWGARLNHCWTVEKKKEKKIAAGK
jgi:hypothetical protein